ncbi:hypothetical protein I2F27_05795 [Acinetobacter sp. B5B]|uniref:hypothetical protein n=1 Tax=Acinetobacter baretiae TaxID=2605383 RepID=UPI0018C1D2AF|nr:hypothetical protein [Acinetobacter baretiae]MBF7685467.1 hypothetical protein [Acinetobacter baretiae]
MKKMMCCMGLIAVMSSSMAYSAQIVSHEEQYNIAKGFMPTSPEQSIQSLRPFLGDFRILSTQQYSQDEQAKFSPIDFAVSWGLFAHKDFAQRIHVQQYDRFLNWKMNPLPVSPQKAMQMVSNMHMIPASPEILEQLNQVKKGDLVRLQGDLVEIKDGNLVWRSSLTNTDVGEGGCELFRVKQVQWLQKVQM